MDNLFDRILNFIHKIGLTCHLEPIVEKTFLPGLKLRQGALIIDVQKLCYIGDILHEAGHLACMPLEIRGNMNDNLEDNNLNQGGEMMAIAWSYAACIYLDIDPHIVFHDDGYRGGGSNIVTNFRQENYFGVPLLEWNGMCLDKTKAKESNKKPFPEMIFWTCQKNRYTLPG